MKTSIQRRITRILRWHFLVRLPRFAPAQRLEHDYNLGPLDQLELALCLEQAFHFDFQNRELAEFRTLGSVVASVERHLHPAAHRAPRPRPAKEFPAA